MKTVWANQSIPDEEVLTLATEKKRVLLTTNRPSENSVASRVLINKQFQDDLGAIGKSRMLAA
jgi:hypothetical protein